jgi:hypothetical protein
MTTSTGRIERGRMALIAYQGHDELTGGLADLLEDLAAYHLERIGSPEATRTTFTLAAARAAGDHVTTTADLELEDGPRAAIEVTINLPAGGPAPGAGDGRIAAAYAEGFLDGRRRARR